MVKLNGFSDLRNLFENVEIKCIKACQATNVFHILSQKANRCFCYFFSSVELYHEYVLMIDNCH